ncbi:MAG: pseudouridine synthase [Cyclobacteriaceae bacterium]
MTEPLEIVYQDDQLLAINKPHGLLVHRSPIAKDAEVFALQLLRDQVGQHVFPLHRLDRKTGGLLLFAKDEESSRAVQKLFATGSVEKTYLAIVRGFTEEEGVIDYPLKKENGKVQEAVTAYRTLGRAELAVPVGKHDTSRYSLLEVKPRTGRMHQIRRHLAHIFHPIIADRPHGCNKQNALFKNRWQMDTMLLHASSLGLVHPVNQKKIHLKADIQKEFRRMINMMQWQGILNEE